MLEQAADRVYGFPRAGVGAQASRNNASEISDIRSAT